MLIPLRSNTTITRQERKALIRYRYTKYPKGIGALGVLSYWWVTSLLIQRL